MRPAFKGGCGEHFWHAIPPVMPSRDAGTSPVNFLLQMIGPQNSDVSLIQWASDPPTTGRMAVLPSGVLPALKYRNVTAA
jgi:hypothetical protein